MTQVEYIEILFGDCGFDGPQRRAWLRAEYGRAYADELPPAHKHQVIERLKALKAAQRDAEKARADDASGTLDFG